MWGSAGPCHAELGIPMDMNIGLRSRSGVMASLVLSFNSRGPAAIREGCTPESSFAACLPTMRLLDKIDRAMSLTPR